MPAQIPQYRSLTPYRPKPDPLPSSSKVYFLPTYLAPMMVAGLVFGIGMVVGGYCPGTSLVASATGKIDAIVFIVGFFAGSLLFGDLFPIWRDFYESDFRGPIRLDQHFNLGLGVTIFLVVLIAVAGSLLLRQGQRHFWEDRRAQARLEPGLVAAGVVLGAIMAFFPTHAFVSGAETVLAPDHTPGSGRIVPAADAVGRGKTVTEPGDEVLEEDAGLIIEEGC